MRLAVCGWRFGRYAVWAVGGLGGIRFGRLAVCAVGGLRDWRSARLAVCEIADWCLAVAGGLGGLRLAVCVWRYAFGGLRLADAFGGLRLAVGGWLFAFGGLRLAVDGLMLVVGG